MPTGVFSSRPLLPCDPAPRRALPPDFAGSEDALSSAPDSSAALPASAAAGCDSDGGSFFAGRDGRLRRETALGLSSATPST